MNNFEISGSLLKKMIFSAAENLFINKEILNNMNVFPVPDGDTGTNMGLTVEAASKKAAAEGENSVSKVAKAISNGALSGARGNSGVILSQLFRGFAKSLEGKETAGTLDLAEAFSKSVELAYKAVMKPQEGTILTVARELAVKAREMAVLTDDIEEFMTEVIKHGYVALSKTTLMLEVLRQANVVDAGGKGLMLIMDGAFNALLNAENIPEIELVEVKKAKSPLAAANVEIEFGYCTEFFVRLDAVNDKVEDELKAFLSGIGDSIVVAADDKLVKIHLHTNNPGLVIEKALSYGQIDDLKVDNMRIQHSHIFEDLQADIVPASGIELSPQEYKETGIVSISSGKGLSYIFSSLGVDMLVEGGQSMNPSTEDIVNAINAVNSKNVIVLPNNRNIVLAAQQAAYMVKDKVVKIIPTSTIPQGINAVMHYDMSLDFEKNLDKMQSSIGLVKSIAVTYAVRDSVLDDKKIEEGDLLGLLESSVVVAEKTLENCVAKLLLENVSADDEIITIYVGEDVTDEVAGTIFESVKASFPEIEVEMHRGEQAIYYFIISIE